MDGDLHSFWRNSLGMWLFGTNLKGPSLLPSLSFPFVLRKGPASADSCWFVWQELSLSQTPRHPQTPAGKTLVTSSQRQIL